MMHSQKNIKLNSLSWLYNTSLTALQRALILSNNILSLLRLADSAPIMAIPICLESGSAQ